MANIKSAKKRIRVIETKTRRNRRVKGHLKEILKRFETAVATGDRETARNTLALAEKRLMQAASKGILHGNTASRKVSRITTKFSQTFGQEALLEKAVKPEIPVKEKKPAKVKEDVAEAKAVVEEAPKATTSTKIESAEEAAVTETEAVEDATATEEEKPTEND
jgi:small subunit ribosomal protein S20